ncbi:MAG: hypothetical protein EPN49_00130 [Rhodanobacter sp.]|nr:MAG: hypothetical protein EPN49_00130 [Rhodanobacter sp.]
MQHTARRFPRALAWVCLIAGLGAAMPALAAAPAATEAARAASTKTWAVILDPQLPLTTRQQALEQLIDSTKVNDQHNLYLLGSLYWMGQRASGAPVQRDLNQAAIYMSNAAIHGSLLGMAKMAEIELALHKYSEAMIWAQVYAHYAMQLPRNERPNEGYTAELVQRIIDKLGRAGVTQAMPQVSNFIALHDTDIRAGSDSDFDGRQPHPVSKTRPYLTPDYRFVPKSGIADYLLAFHADGSEAHAWLLDATPDPALGEALRQYAHEMTLPPTKAQAGDGLRYAWSVVMFDDRRYRMAGTKASR